MKIGASSACFYPLETEKSIKALGELGFELAEIFVNAECELSGKIFEEIKSTADHYGISFTSMHPFTSFAESNMLFSAYKRRFTDGLEFCKKYFDACNKLDIGILVIHGCKKRYPISDEEYFERFGILCENAARFGIITAQENVVDFKSESPEFLSRMRLALGDKFKMVFDIKQSVRTGIEPIPFAKEFSKDIIHLHLSDYTDELICIPPGKGNFDFAALSAVVKEAGYKGAGVIELYNNGYKQPQEITESKKYLQKIGF